VEDTKYNLKHKTKVLENAIENGSFFEEQRSHKYKQLDHLQDRLDDTIALHGADDMKHPEIQKIITLINDVAENKVQINVPDVTSFPDSSKYKFKSPHTETKNIETTKNVPQEDRQQLQLQLQLQLPKPQVIAQEQEVIAQVNQIKKHWKNQKFQLTKNNLQ